MHVSLGAPTLNVLLVHACTSYGVRVDGGRLVADVDDKAIDDALKQIAERNVTYTPEAAAAADKGDKLTIDFVGKINGEAFDGGTAEGLDLVLGDPERARALRSLGLQRSKAFDWQRTAEMTLDFYRKVMGS